MIASRHNPWIEWSAIAITVGTGINAIAPALRFSNPPKQSTIKSQKVYGTNIEAFLATIRYAEGTSGEDGYRTMFTGRKFDSFAKHPDVLNCAIVSGSKLCSTAAGAYQYLTPTWNATAKRIGAKDFSPKNQDLGAINLIENAGALPLIEKGEFEKAIVKVSPIWASLPNGKGLSVYAYTGQSARSMAQLKKVYLASGGTIAQ